MRKLILVGLALLPGMLSAQPFPSDQVQKVLDKVVDQKRVFGAVISISQGDETYHFASGNMQVDDAYFIASVTKLYTASVLFKLADEGQLSLDDPITKYFPEETLNGLHVYEGTDYTAQITLRHLVTNTSGLADYFMQEEDAESLMETLTANKDTALSFDQMMAMTKGLPAQFAPGTPGKAYYSDGNFQLLGQVIQQVTGKSLQEAYEAYIFQPLGLTETYVYDDPNDTRPINFYHKKDQLHIPLMMASFQADGGIVSTAGENLTFLKAYLGGELFSHDQVDINSGWNKIYTPFQYGHGIMKFKFPGQPEMIGHAGASGSFAYYIPSADVFITGTINQMAKPQIAYRLIAKVLSKVD